MTLVSPSDVLQEWDVGGTNGCDVVGACSSGSSLPSSDATGDGAASFGLNDARGRAGNRGLQWQMERP